MRFHNGMFSWVWAFPTASGWCASGGLGALALAFGENQFAAGANALVVVPAQRLVSRRVHTRDRMNADDDDIPAHDDPDRRAIAEMSCASIRTAGRKRVAFNLLNRAAIPG